VLFTRPSPAPRPATRKSFPFRIVLLAVAVGAVGLPAQTVGPHEENQESSPYFGNPFHKANPESETDRTTLLAPRVFHEIFDTDLPGVDADSALQFRLNPKFGDVVRDDYIRWPIGVRYNFNTHLEGQFDYGLYSGNPFGSGDGFGSYEIVPGFKYTMRHLFESDWNLAFGARARLPIADPPVEITDGYARYLPFLSFSRELNRDPAVLGYVNLRYEWVDETPFTAHPVVPQPRDRIFVMPGVIYYPGGRFRYGLELEYRTSAISLSASEDRPSDLEGPLTDHQVRAYDTVHELIAHPSITWFPTHKTRQGMRLPGNWDLGMRIDIPLVEETGEDFGLSVRFRWYYNYGKLLRRFFDVSPPEKEND